MNKTVLICLAAVVVIIVIIALAALRFLRAEDSDPFEELPEEPRRPSRTRDEAPIRDRVPAAAASRRGRPAAAEEPSWSAERGPDMRPDRGTGPRQRPAAERSPAADRRTQTGPQRPVPVGARSARPSRPAGQDGGPDWDTMSDVDYWAELAADKPFSTAVSAATGSASPANGGRPQGPVSDGRQSDGRQSDGRQPDARQPDARQPGRGDQTQLPARPRQGRPAAAARAADLGQPADSRPSHAPGRYAGEAATQNIAALSRLASQSPAAQAQAGQVPAAQLRQPRPARARSASQPGPQPRSGLQPASQQRTQPRPAQPAPLDDDPLTSPSFPAINASDSRSYRSSEPGGQPRGHRGAPAYAEPTQQFSTYPAAGHSTSAPNGYPVQPAASHSTSAPNGYPIQPAASRSTSPPNGYPIQPAATAAANGNPYGSFVTQPPAQRPEAPAASSPEVGYGGYPAQPGSGSEGWYASPLPVAGNGQVVPTVSQPAGGYPPGGAVSNGYDQAGYAGLQPDPSYQQGPYQGPRYDQAGYAGQDTGYARESYQGYQGYGTSGY
ncbi:MAG TPA: hypothetical protein VEL03_03565 [Streptosporangiaceae bacterium]|nr:hypothetical protein [Streptosporangiaceae bacterium]